ncbi:MAG TPA: aminoacyl-tRNA hydrolase [Candidatus Binataceae bacterium]|nr:aminoacyl-tRNA hydrolase [Candidatus Binataceae bacterium]
MSPIGRLFRHFRAAKSAAQAPSDGGGEVQWIIAGLGNPGEEYQRARHNLGFMTVERFATSHELKLSRRRFKANYAQTTIEGRGLILAEPETFYNLSGDCLSAMLGYFKVPVERLIVVHDDLDLEAGRLRLKRGGGDAGNRGVRSIAERLGADFIRIRIGVGRPPTDDDSKDFVLKPMTRGELASFAPVVARAAEAVETLVVTADLDRAMGRYNQRPG